MRNQKLSAYSLHHRAYQDKRSLYYLFTKEFGMVHGVGKRGVAQFVPLSLFATGKKSLKTFRDMSASHMVTPLLGQQQYAGLYLNEITLKLLPIEDPFESLYAHYALTLNALGEPLKSQQLRLVLRHYERVLFSELGFAIEMYQDSEQKAIQAQQHYRFVADIGWVATDSVSDNDLIQHENNSASASNTNNTIKGKSILAMQKGINSQTLPLYSLLHRQLIDHLFDYKPLQSRVLWQQSARYQ